VHLKIINTSIIEGWFVMLNNRVGKQVAIIVCIALVINAGAIFGAQPETEPSNVGGPDAFGYSWTDNKAPSPVIAYNWIEISGTGTDTGLNGGDVADGPFPIGFSFSFYGNAYTQLNLNSKGYISLSTVTFDFSNDPIPNTATPNNIIAAYWDDLAVYNNYGGYCYYETIGASPNRQCVVEWYHICPYGGAGTPQMTFEIILNETGEIWFQYYALNGMSGSSASVGIENIDGTIGLQYCYNTAGIISDGLAIRFSLAQTGQVSITPDQQTSGGLPGSNVDYAFTISNTETQADTFNLSTDNQIIFNGTNWTKYGMVLDIGGVYDSVFAVGPSVIKDNGTYKMWYDGIDGSYGRILYATSIDGLTWIKQGLALDFGGVYESASVYDPCVLKIDGEYKMWYGGDDGVNIRILFANSTDGIAWQKQGLVLDIGGSGEDSVVGGPCVIRDGGLYKMWYTARGTNLQIFYATSPDGLSWTKYGLVLPYGGTYEGSFVFGATVVKDDMYRMWYTGDTGGRKRILYATSPDGAAWTKLGLAVNYGGVPYEDDSVDTPTVLLDGNLAKMWYSGYDWTPASGRIFFATSPYIMQGNQWPVTFRDATNSYNITNISVPASSNAQFIARVSIPGSASIGEYEVATLTATSQNNSAISDTAIINTTCSDSPIIVPHAPIRINSNADFNAAHGVSAGNGSQINPWIIQNYEIDGTGCGYCIYVGNTTDYFTIRNCALHHANGINSYPYFWNTAIICYEVDNAYIMNNSMTFNNQMAIFFYYCTNCVISDNNASYNYGYTIYTEYSTFNTIRNNWVSDGDNCGIAVCWSSHNNTVENNCTV
jgi:parallel beta-helix repeat protein